MKNKHTFIRNTGRAIVIKDGFILLNERWHDGLHYYSIPGGGVDKGEDSFAAAIREIKEETSIDIEIIKKAYIVTDGNSEHDVFLAKHLSGKPFLPPDSEEAQAGPDNLYKPLWFPVSDLPNIDLGFWQPLNSHLVNDLKLGFPTDKLIKI